MIEGLFSIHVRLGDGQSEKGSGVLVLHGGALRGGDAFLYYTGSYRMDGERMNGEVVINQHTPSPGKWPLFGGSEVGVGFSGSVTPDGGILEGFALVRKQSVRFHASLRKLSD